VKSSEMYAGVTIYPQLSKPMCQERCGKLLALQKKTKKIELFFGWHRMFCETSMLALFWCGFCQLFWSQNKFLSEVILRIFVCDR
jgi:hypothetical protein